MIESEKFEVDVETLRQLVKLQATMYDPMGILVPFILLGRKIIQMAMQGKWGWDTRLSQSVIDMAIKWLRSIKNLKAISVPRPLDNEDTVDMPEELHVFSDASLGGYGVVMYRRVMGRSGAVRVTFLGGKSHVVPLNPSRASHHNSIPRLELVAATKAAEMAMAMEKSLKRKFGKRRFHVDSECVLGQIEDEKTNHKAFVGNRLSKIRKIARPSEFRYVDSKNNPADLCSRGIQAHETEKWKFYLEGPEFLKKREECWPKRPVPDKARVSALTQESRCQEEQEEQESAGASTSR